MHRIDSLPLGYTPYEERHIQGIDLSPLYLIQENNGKLIKYYITDREKESPVVKSFYDDMFEEYKYSGKIYTQHEYKYFVNGKTITVDEFNNGSLVTSDDFPPIPEEE